MGERTTRESLHLGICAQIPNVLKRDDDYIPPKRPYSFHAMLYDILDFAVLSLVDNGRLSFWMPTANDEDQEIQVPEHPCLEITSTCTQTFNRCEYALLSS
jgi:tRNA (guanine10-N2)-methyltransferase